MQHCIDPSRLYAAIVDSSNTYSIGDVARFAQQLGIDIGRTRLYEYLRNNGFLCKTVGDWNAPTDDSIECEYFKEIIDFECSDGKLRNVTRVTGKGLIRILNQLFEDMRIIPLVDGAVE